MFTVPRTRLEALPYYARFIAIMNPFFKDMGKDLCTRLEDEFKQLFQEKDQINIETKIKNIRFLSELVKFKVCPTNTIFTFLKMCLDDFKHHNVDVACALLETCGRYLYRTPETHIRTQTLVRICASLDCLRFWGLDVSYVEICVAGYYDAS
jgi:regulator of nonsense transcripts 2